MADAFAQQRVLYYGFEDFKIFFVREIGKLAKRNDEAQELHALDSKRVDLRSSHSNGSSMARMISFGKCSGTVRVVVIEELVFDELSVSFLRFGAR